MRPDEPPVFRALQGTCLILGPALAATATFRWQDGRYGVRGGFVLALAMAVWLCGLLGVWDRIRERLPLLGSAGAPLAVLGALGGTTFALQGFFEAAFGLSAEQSLDALAEHPVESAILLWSVAGPAFPLSMIVLGVALIRARLAPLWVGLLLAFGGAAFPLSRIPREVAVAHLADLLLLVPSAYLGWRLLAGVAVRTATPPRLAR